MRKALSFLLGLLLLGLSIPAGAVTLAELRSEAPERLAMEVDGPNGAVFVDAPTILPDGETLPILRAKPRKLNVDSAYAAYGLPDENYMEGREDTYDYIFSVSGVYWSDSEMFVPDSLGGEANAIRVPSLDESLDNNPLPWDAPDRLLHEILSLIGAGDADVRVLQQVAMSRPYQVETQSNGAYFAFAAKLDQPIEGRDKGYYATTFVQYLYGAPIFGEVYRHLPFGEGTPYFSPSQLIFSRMLSEQDFSLSISLLEPLETVSEDAELASFDLVRQTIEGRIRSGDLKDIQSISLGYQMVYNLAYEQWNPALQGKPAEQQYVLVPCWQVNGYDVKDEIELKNGRVDVSSDIPTALEYAFIGSKSGGAAPLALRINACTGQVFRGEDFYWGN